MKLTKKGFTLIEMLIVIVIIGILAAALIPRLTGIQGRARDTARKADLNQLSTSLSTYNLDNNKYPAQSGSWADTSGAVLNVLSGYMTSMPVENSTSWMPYKYQSNSTTFVLAAVSEGGGVNANWSGGTAGAATQLSEPNAVALTTTPVKACTAGLPACIGSNKAGFRYILSN